MKKLLVMLMCMSLLAGCSSNNDSTDVDNKTPENNTTDSVADDTKDTTNDWYGRFESELKNKSVAYTSRSTLNATSIGGAEGYRYTTENGNVDVYRFEDGEEFEKIKKDKKITVDGKEYNVSIKDKMVIVTDNLKDDVKNVFEGMK